MAPLPRVFLDIKSLDISGRLTIELFVNDVPKTCENFRCLCTGERGPKLSYQNSIFHRIIADPDFMVQGGDIENNDGTGGISIYGRTFDDENIGWRSIDERGLVCMASKGPNTNASQFFITLIPCPDLDQKNVVFGRLTQESMNVLDDFANVLTDPDNDDRPVEGHEPKITKCGELLFKKKSKVVDAKELSKLSSKRGRSASRSSSRSELRSSFKSLSGSRSLSRSVSRTSSGRSDSQSSRQSRSGTASPALPPKQLTKEKQALQLPRNPLLRTEDSDDRWDRPRYQNRKRASPTGLHESHDGPLRRDRGRIRHDNNRRDGYKDKNRHANDWLARDNDQRFNDRARSSRLAYDDNDKKNDRERSKSPPQVKYKGRGNMKYRE
ncbi:cyclophilin-like domain-protein [Lipomyces arxii]|uniref:cyclophilin-like domain-protein n=1 Tax=Lipomyces arxii TaxID=56418 RepID=UPI0034CF738A